MLLGGLAVLGPAESASAWNHVIDSGKHSCRTDVGSGVCSNNSQTHYISPDLGPLMSSALNHTLYGSYDTTDLIISCCHPHTSGDEDANENDVYYYSTDLPGNEVGKYRCRKRKNDQICRHAHVAFDVGIPTDSSSASVQYRRNVACHETGHTVGLLHGEDADPPITGSEAAITELLRCMDSESTPATVGPHNVAHIDDHS